MVMFRKSVLSILAGLIGLTAVVPAHAFVGGPQHIAWNVFQQVGLPSWSERACGAIRSKLIRTYVSTISGRYAHIQTKIGAAQAEYLAKMAGRAKHVAKMAVMGSVGALAGVAILGAAGYYTYHRWIKAYDENELEAFNTLKNIQEKYQGVFDNKKTTTELATEFNVIIIKNKITSETDRQQKLVALADHIRDNAEKIKTISKNKELYRLHSFAGKLSKSLDTVVRQIAVMMNATPDVKVETTRTEQSKNL